ncbi:MAG: hypothetical protein GF320_14660, partial [Armatimonadia bacterium]|nr:hypothetical protein [Armatimonadia bacterium]
MSLCLCILACTAPWWDNFPTTYQGRSPGEAATVHATSAMGGVTDDPGWGIAGLAMRYHGMIEQAEAYEALGIHSLAYAETFGTAACYIAEFEKGPGGGLVGYDSDPSVPKPTLNAWAWQLREPGPRKVIHWVGLPAYYDEAEWCGPWTRAHPLYGAPPFTYPDGTVARGHLPGPERPDRHRIFDAGASKDILGNVTMDYMQTPAEAVPPAIADELIPYPTADGTAYTGFVNVKKDPACPHWVEYARASSRLMAELGTVGIWSDNFSTWDSLGINPVLDGFGDWSVAGFRDYLRDEMGRTDVDDFDIREYLRATMREKLGGDDSNLHDPLWRDRYWLEDPMWTAYRRYKLDVARRALDDYHAAVREGARLGGVDDFVIQGNDIPLWCFDAPRPEFLEMVSTEFHPGWGLFTGSRGLGLPPRGRMAPFVRAARTHAQGRFVHLWYYLDREHSGRADDPELGRTLAYEALASHAMVQAYPELPKMAGTADTAAEVNGFIDRCRRWWGDREPLARIGLLYSPASRLRELTPGGLVAFDGQRHAFDLLGWGTA